MNEEGGREWEWRKGGKDNVIVSHTEQVVFHSWTIPIALSEQLPTSSLKAACFLTLVPGPSPSGFLVSDWTASLYLVGPFPEEVLNCQTWQVRTHVYKSGSSFSQ